MGTSKKKEHQIEVWSFNNPILMIKNRSKERKKLQVQFIFSLSIFTFRIHLYLELPCIYLFSLKHAFPAFWSSIQTTAWKLNFCNSCRVLCAYFYFWANSLFRALFCFCYFFRFVSGRTERGNEKIANSNNKTLKLFTFRTANLWNLCVCVFADEFSQWFESISFFCGLWCLSNSH